MRCSICSIAGEGFEPSGRCNVLRNGMSYIFSEKRQGVQVPDTWLAASMYVLRISGASKVCALCIRRKCPTQSKPFAETFIDTRKQPRI